MSKRKERISQWNLTYRCSTVKSITFPEQKKNPDEINTFKYFFRNILQKRLLPNVSFFSSSVFPSLPSF